MVHALDKPLRDDVYARVVELKNEKNHERLNVHKLHGKLKAFYGFFVNYQARIVFEKINPKKYLLHIVGGREIYE